MGRAKSDATRFGNGIRFNEGLNADKAT
jgi:hypothetical protein